jgi:hypothetical protein
MTAKVNKDHTSEQLASIYTSGNFENISVLA